MTWPCFQPCPPQPPCQFLPLTTGRVGLSQTTGELDFYGHNYRGTGIGLFHGRCTQWKGGVPYWGAGPCCSGSFSDALAAILTGSCP